MRLPCTIHPLPRLPFNYWAHPGVFPPSFQIPTLFIQLLWCTRMAPSPRLCSSSLWMLSFTEELLVLGVLRGVVVGAGRAWGVIRKWLHKFLALIAKWLLCGQMCVSNIELCWHQERPLSLIQLKYGANHTVSFRKLTKHRRMCCVRKRLGKVFCLM